MNKLIDKFKSLVNGYVGSSMLTNTEYPETIEANAKRCVRITIDYVEDFLEWLETSNYRWNDDVKMYKNKDGRLKTKEELIEIFNVL